MKYLPPIHRISTPSNSLGRSSKNRPGEAGACKLAPGACNVPEHELRATLVLTMARAAADAPWRLPRPSRAFVAVGVRCHTPNGPARTL